MSGQAAASYGIALAILAGTAVFLAREGRSWFKVMLAGVADAVEAAGVFF